MYIHRDGYHQRTSQQHPKSLPAHARHSVHGMTIRAFYKGQYPCRPHVDSNPDACLHQPQALDPCTRERGDSPLLTPPKPSARLPSRSVSDSNSTFFATSDACFVNGGKKQETRGVMSPNCLAWRGVVMIPLNEIRSGIIYGSRQYYPSFRQKEHGGPQPLHRGHSESEDR